MTSNGVQRKIQKQLKEAEKERKKLRAAHGCKLFLGGEHSKLLQPDVLLHFIKEVSAGTAISGLPQQLALCLLQSDDEVKECALSLFSLVLSSESKDFSSDSIQSFPSIAEWFVAEDKYYGELPVFCKPLMLRLEEALLLGEYALCLPLVKAFQQISSGHLFKDIDIQNEVETALDQIVTPAILSDLWQKCRESNPEVRKTLLPLFIHFGEKAGRFLLRQMMHAKEREERILVVKILSHFDRNFSFVLYECLGNKPPWFVARNILSILRKLDVDINREFLELCASYTDQRVQVELVHILKEKGGDSLGEQVFDILPNLVPKLQAELVATLMSCGDENLSHSLGDYIERHLNVFIEQEGVLLALCDLWTRKPSEESLIMLQHIYDEARVRPQLIRLAHFASNGIAIVRPILRHQDRLEHIPEHIRQNIDPSEIESIERVAQTILAKVDESLAGSSKEARAKALVALSKKYCKKKELGLAQLLYDRAISMDPKNAEKYEEVEGLLYDEQEFYYSMVETIESLLSTFLSEDQVVLLRDVIQIEEYRTGECLVRQGEINPCLYFVLEGEVYLSCNNYGKDVFLKKLGSGMSMGHSSFMSATFWSEKGTATMPTTVAVLPFVNCLDLFSDNSLFQGLADFCRRENGAAELVLGANVERRRHPRVKPNFSVKLRIVDQINKKLSYPIAGTVQNASTHGLSVSICLNGQKNVHSFLGIEVSVSLEHDGVETEYTGYVIAVRPFTENTHTLHLKIVQALEPSILQAA